MYNIIRNTLTLLLSSVTITSCFTQNSMVGDGFGGRKWYSPTNYTVGSYSAYSLCYEECEDSPNQLYGWGENNYNQLGMGQLFFGIDTPIAIPNMSNVEYYSTGYIMGAIKKDSTGWAWGGQITGAPIQVINNAYFLDASSTTISFVKYDGTVWSIGYNSSGQFGDGSTNNSYTIPVQMQNISNAVRVANNGTTTIILLSDSTLMTVGDNSNWGLGLGTAINQTLTPLPITTLNNIVDVKSHNQASIALDDSGYVYQWGLDQIIGDFNIPTKLPFLSNIIAISGCDDGYHFMALDENGNCYAWGLNNYGQCGYSTSLTPPLVATNVIDIMAGETFSYIVKSDGTLWGTGASLTYSIWLNLSDTGRTFYTKIDPSQVPGTCSIVGGGLPCDSATFLAEPIFINNSIYFPNVFTPNGDDENDNFYFPNWGVSDLKCEIYNRWGTKIYEWLDKDGFWDGRTTAGKECSDGTYYYIVSYKRENSENWERHTGYISLLR